jgi:hypothetical protein
MKSFAKLLLIVLSAATIVPAVANTPTQPNAHKNKNTKLRAAAFGLASATFGCASAATAYIALCLQNLNNFETTKFAATLGATRASLLFSKEKKDEIGDEITKSTEKYIGRAALDIIQYAALSYIFLQGAKYCWGKACKSSAEKKE